MTANRNLFTSLTRNNDVRGISGDFKGFLGISEDFKGDLQLALISCQDTQAPHADCCRNNSFLNLVNLNQNWIVITLFR